MLQYYNFQVLQCYFDNILEMKLANFYIPSYSQKTLLFVAKCTYFVCLTALL